MLLTWPHGVSIFVLLKMPDPTGERRERCRPRQTAVPRSHPIAGIFVH
jgi:hypothetical protein